MDPHFFFYNKMGSIDASFFWHHCSTGKTFQTSHLDPVGGSNVGQMPHFTQAVIIQSLEFWSRRSFAASPSHVAGAVASSQAAERHEIWSPGSIGTIWVDGHKPPPTRNMEI